MVLSVFPSLPFPIAEIKGNKRRKFKISVKTIILAFFTIQWLDDHEQIISFSESIYSFMELEITISAP